MCIAHNKLFKLKFYSDTKKAKSIYALAAPVLLSTMNILILFFHNSFQRWDNFHLQSSYRRKHWISKGWIKLVTVAQKFLKLNLQCYKSTSW